MKLTVLQCSIFPVTYLLSKQQGLNVLVWWNCGLTRPATHGQESLGVGMRLTNHVRALC